MNDIGQLMSRLGGIHDSVLTRLCWMPEIACLELEIDDLHANFYGLPEYKGPTKARFVFMEVRRIDIQANLREQGITIYDCVLETDGISKILFSPGGQITIECGKIKLEEI